jgi:hypothetical protein
LHLWTLTVLFSGCARFSRCCSSGVVGHDPCKSLFLASLSCASAYGSAFGERVALDLRNYSLSSQGAQRWVGMRRFGMPLQDDKAATYCLPQSLLRSWL